MRMLRLGCSALALLASQLTGGAALAQDSERKQLVATPSASPLRPAPSNRFAPSLVTTPGMVLEVAPRRAGDDPTWLRVRLPADAGVLVPVAHATPNAERTRVTLRAPSRLIAIDQRDPVNLSFKAVLDEPLGVGSDLPLLRTLAGGDGLPAMYVVAAPAHATAYLPVARTAPPTAEQLDAHLARTRPSQPQTPPGTLATNRPEASDASEAAGVQEPATRAQSGLSDSFVDAIERLNLAYDRVRSSDGVELDELRNMLEEYRKLQQGVEVSSFTERLRAQLDERITTLSVRVRVRERMQSLGENDENLKAMEAEAARIAERIANMDPTYTHIGRLLASLVYTGEDVEKLYILRSTEPGRPVLGYIRATPETDRFVGQVVGVVASPGKTIGTARMLEVRRIGAIPQSE